MRCRPRWSHTAKRAPQPTRAAPPGRLQGGTNPVPELLLEGTANASNRGSSESADHTGRGRFTDPLRTGGGTHSPHPDRAKTHVPPEPSGPRRRLARHLISGLTLPHTLLAAQGGRAGAARSGPTATHRLRIGVGRRANLVDCRYSVTTHPTIGYVPTHQNRLRRIVGWAALRP